MTKSTYTRRQMLQLSATAATALALPTFAAEQAPQSHTSPSLYAQLLETWCDGLLAHQETTIHDPALRGALLCPACAIIHGRCGDAVYPLLRVAHTTGKAKYLEAALLVHEWSEQQVSRADGSWINDVTLSSWKGITVFHSIALAEALHHHGAILDTATRQRWTDRLARAAKFLDTFITIDTGNINYPVTSSHCFALCAQVLNEPHYNDRARQLAHASLDYFTANNLLFGEGHPQTATTAKHCRPVDLGYNVEESLPSLAQYALLTNDQPVLEKTIAALRAHMEFMLPDGSWDNSWGSRNYKWTWWGSRTSDGCHPAYVLLAQHEPKFLEVAHRNLELMSACTHNGLLYGGPDYFAHGDQPCIHHTFTHAKSLATVLDSNVAQLTPSPRLTIPRDAPYGLKSYPEIGTHLASIGPWRATVTGYDFEYIERVQSGGGGASGGGHASGGALSLLYHQQFGPILTASMTEYQMIEISNQQVHLDKPHMCLTPRIESAGKQTYTSLSDFEATIIQHYEQISAALLVSFDVRGHLLTASHQPPPVGDARYHLTYSLTDSAVRITASVDAPPQTPLQFILPVISRSSEAVTQTDPKTIQIKKPNGTLAVSTDAHSGFEAIPKERIFNLVPGFECIPLAITMQPGQEIHIQLEASLKK
ncbi:MAG TPA: hypothetical protein VNY74_02690 [Edaphobacter sp.]|jgi:hypothetical protein|nr:hypothetical protein [Edaphobacter sp.]